MTTPMVSVVIPTFGRPQWLGRAIQSAFLAETQGDVEVIVVPNGPDAGWHEMRTAFAHDARVRFFPIVPAHANVARTHGLRLASGRYVRFLDDDDYLLSAAAHQVQRLEATGDDVCSGLLANLDEAGVDRGTVRFTATRDFVIACTEVTGFTLPTGNLFRAERLAGREWDNGVRRAQDYVWMLSLAKNHEWRWTHLDEQVGVWFQHGEPRTSTTRPGGFTEPPVPNALIALHDALAATGRLDYARAEAIGDALWNYAHVRFAFHPLHATRIARIAARISPASRPTHPLMRAALIATLSPLLAEWLLLPARYVSILLRTLAGKYRDHQRQL